MDGESTKICPQCAESVNAAARLCPHCRSDLRRSAIHLKIADWVVISFLGLMFCGVLILFVRVARPWEDFTKHREEVAVADSSVQFSSPGDRGQYVTTVGTIKNSGECAWKDIQVEVRYFDQAGKLIDVGVQMVPDLVVQPHSESAFRVRTLADQSESAYASHKVVVRTARDERCWP